MDIFYDYGYVNLDFFILFFRPVSLVLSKTKFYEGLPVPVTPVFSEFLAGLDDRFGPG